MRRSPRALQAGTVNVDEGYALAFGSTAAPMGGMKASGVGRRHGADGILKYTESQTVSTARVINLDAPLGIPQIALWRRRFDPDDPVGAEAARAVSTERPCPPRTNAPLASWLISPAPSQACPAPSAPPRPATVAPRQGCCNPGQRTFRRTAVADLTNPAVEVAAGARRRRISASGEVVVADHLPPQLHTTLHGGGHAADLPHISGTPATRHADLSGRP